MQRSHAFDSILIIVLTVFVGFDPDAYACWLELENFWIGYLLIDVERDTNIFQMFSRDILRLAVAVLIAESLPNLTTLILAITNFPSQRQHVTIA